MSQHSQANQTPSEVHKKCNAQKVPSTKKCHPPKSAIHQKSVPPCADESSENVQLLRLEEPGIRVAQFLRELPAKKLLEKKLHEAIRLARERLARAEPPNRISRKSLKKVPE